MYEGVESAGLGEGIETAMGYTSPEIQFGSGDGNGHFPMPDFAPEQGGELSSEELTHMLLEPEQAEVDSLDAKELAEEDKEMAEVRGLETGEIDQFVSEHGTTFDPSDGQAEDS
jgi:hypothetical protein